MNKIELVLSEVPGTLRKLAAERDSLAEENAKLQAQLSQIEMNKRITKIAETIHSKGLQRGTYEETVQMLNDKAAANEIDLIDEAVKLASPEASVFGYLGDRPQSGSNSLEEYILS